MKVKSRSKGQALGTILAGFFVLVAVALIFLKPSLLILWLIIAILLYSYNFIILLIPTTTVEKTHIKDRIDVGQLSAQFKEIATHLILRKRRLAVEVGLTIFFGGMVPLALSFSIIFAVGLVFGSREGRQQHGGQDGNDRNDHQQFDERKTASAPSERTHMVSSDSRVTPNTGNAAWQARR